MTRWILNVALLSGKELRTLEGHQDVVKSAAFNSDGTRVVTTSFDKTAKVWDVLSGKEFARTPARGVLLASEHPEHARRRRIGDCRALGVVALRHFEGVMSQACCDGVRSGPRLHCQRSPQTS